jgi:TrmH family RNA methyltransferase
VALAEDVAGRDEGIELAREAAAAGAAVRVLNGKLLASLSEVETSGGVLALGDPPACEEAAMFRGTPLILVACGIQDPGNLGGLLRTAEAAGGTGAMLGVGSADPWSWKSLRGAMGSAFRLPILRNVKPLDAVDELGSRGIKTVATASRAETRHDRADLRGPLAVFVGAEGPGLPEEVLRAVDERVSIEMAPGVESLNVGVAAGVVLFEAARQRRAGTPDAA